MPNNFFYLDFVFVFFFGSEVFLNDFSSDKMKQLISIPMMIWIFMVIIIAGCDAQGIKSISDNQNNDGPSSPVFFHRQRK